MNRKIEVIENKEVGRKKMSLSYAERDNFFSFIPSFSISSILFPFLHFHAFRFLSLYKSLLI